MKRDELAHILRAACEITGDPEILVIGSQAILGTYDDADLPPETLRSIEADIAFFSDRDESIPTKADLIDGAIGELSRFHETYGVYGQGVSVSTAVLPDGWRERLVRFEDAEAGASRAVCLEPHDLVVSKLVAGREKDRAFADALLEAGLVAPDILRARAEGLDTSVVHRRRVVEWIDAAVRRLGDREAPG